MGYRTEEGLFSADEVGAPHVRSRFFILGYTSSAAVSFAEWGMEPDSLSAGGWNEGDILSVPSGDELAHANDGTGSTEQGLEHHRRGLPDAGGGEPETVADPDRVSRARPLWAEERCGRFAQPETGRRSPEVPDTHRECTEVVHNHGRQGGASDYKAYSHLAQTTSKPGHTCSPKCRRLNPLFVERLLGWPRGWTLLPLGPTDLESSVMEWSRWWRLMRSALSRLE